MKWVKHDTDAHNDAKLQNVLLDYGLEGYGLYWYCIELIAGRVDKDNITFELEHDARIIARNTGSTAVRVTEMMQYFIRTGLFESDEGVVTCLKLAKRLDQSMTSNKQMREIIQAFKISENKSLTNDVDQQPDLLTVNDLLDDLKNDEDKNHLDQQVIDSHDSVMIESWKPMQEEIRGDKNKLEEKENKNSDSFDADKAFEDFWADYPIKRGKAAAKTKFKAKCKSHKKFLAISYGLTEYNLLWAMIGKVDEFIPNPPHPTTWLNGERWEDEIQKISPQVKTKTTTAYRHLHGQELCDYCDTIKVHHHGKTEYELYQAIEAKLKKMNQ